MRKFSILSESGDSYPLNGERGVYLSEPSGLGYSLSPSYADLSNGFFLLVGDVAEPQSILSYKLTFTGKNPYELYRSFIGWLSAAGRLTLAYRPDSAQTYYRDVNINYIQKAELTLTRWLEVPVSMYGLTPWYTPTPIILQLEASDEGADKRYDYEYGDDLRYGADSTAAFSALVVNGGHVPAAMHLEYRGAITNPTVRLIGMVSGKTHGVCSIRATLVESDTLLISTKSTDSYAIRRSAHGVKTDLLDVLDLSLNPFFKIPVDEPCILTVEADSAIVGTADLEIYYYYRSV